MASSASTIIDEEQVQEQNIATDQWNNSPVVIPEDDYKWKKYGQKYIVRIQKSRSYYKCRNKNCEARKNVEWPLNEPNKIEIIYKGDHNHRALVGSDGEAGIAANQYDLATQMFGSRT